MAGTYERFYGLDWPKGTSQVFVDLIMGKNWRFAPYCHGNLLDPWEHLLRAARRLFTPEELGISRWTEEHFRDWAMETFCITWGCAGSSKSSDYGCLAVLDWIPEPTRTVTLFCSTTREMLKMRSYEAVQRYFHILKRNPFFHVPGKESKTTTAIINDDDPDNPAGPTSTSGKASIRGVAVEDGGSTQGAHLPAVRYIIDELSLMKPAVMDARTNLRIGTRDLRVFGLCNPESLYDTAAKFSVPVDGWASVDENTPEWRSHYGKVRHHNGFQSPAILEPGGEEKYPYLINQKQIDDILREEHGNTDAPKVWTMIKGFPPPAGIERTLLTEKEVVAFEASAPPVWRDDQSFHVFAAVDPAFSSSGDNCVLAVARVGVLSTGQAAIGFLEPVYIPILASSHRPVIYQISDFLAKAIPEYGLSLVNMAADDSGNQSLCDVVDIEIGRGITRYSFGSSPTERPISLSNPTPAKERVRNLVTEMHSVAAEFVRCRQVRGLPAKMAQQWTTRRFKPGAGRMLEGKPDFKKRTGGASPDEGDAGAMVCMLIRDKLGFLPGGAPTGTGAVNSVSGPAGSGMLPSLRTKYVASGLPSRLDSYLVPRF